MNAPGEPDRLDRLLGVPLLFQPAVSPDGRWIAWSWAGVRPTAQVFLVPTDGSSAPRSLELASEDAMVTAWAPDSSAVILAGDRDGDERVRLYRARVDGGGPEPLTEAAPRCYITGGAAHPNGRWIVYTANRDAAGDREIEAAAIYRHDLSTGERRVLAHPSSAARTAPALNRSGSHVLYFRRDRHPAGRQLWLIQIDGGDDRPILDFGERAKVSGSWSPDGRQVLFVAETGTHVRVGLWSLADGGIEWLLDDPRRRIEAAWWPHGSERVVVVEVEGARARASFLDPSTGRIEAAAPAAEGTLIPLAPAADGRWVWRRYGGRQPDDLVLMGADGLTRSLTGLAKLTTLSMDELAAPADFRWRGDDGLEIQGWLYRARPPVKGTIVAVHGGPTAHAEDRFKAPVQYLVGEGFNVLEPNYRGSTGFGLAFREAIKRDGWGGKEQDDIRAGIEALVAAGIALPGRIGITGVSFGGYSCWCAVTRWPRALVAAAAPICGMTDLVIDHDTTRPDLRPYSVEMMGGAPVELPERYRERSPIHFVHRIEVPLLIVQGLKDPNVTPRNASAVQAALDAAGKKYELLAFADEGHGIAKPANQRVLYRRLAAFFGAAFAATD